MIVALAVFFVSLLGIISLFVLKRWEVGSGRLLAPSIRTQLDVKARQLKELSFAAGADLEKLPPAAMLLGRFLVHLAALEAARLARYIESQSHRVAEMVSHKHRFERRAPRSEFLNKIAEHKNGGNESAAGSRSLEHDASNS